MLTKADHERVQGAIAAAEQATSGEIFCVVAHESSPYRETPFAWAALVAMVAPPIALMAGIGPLERWLGLAGQGWSAAQAAGSAPDLTPILLDYAGAQAILFALALLIASLPPVRRFLTPGSTKRHRVHARALEQFAHRTHATDAHTGVLIYASLAERRVEIIADEVIHAKVGDATWNAAVAQAVKAIGGGDTAAGLIAAVQVCGAVLAEHFPPAADGKAPPSGGFVEV